MKLLSLIAIALMPAPCSCHKESLQEMTVVRDCTGTYLRLDEKDYHVCNTEKVDGFVNGSKVKAGFKKIKNCNGTASEAIVCLMFHQNEGWIEVGKIK